MATNRRLASNEGPDFYVTPAWGTQALIGNESFIGRILEPCCGNGAMAKVLAAAGYKVQASDLYKLGYGSKRDFFAIRRKFDNIVTNPPFNIAEEVLEHALNLARRKVALLLRSAFIESVGRWERFYRERPPSRLLVFSRRLSIYKFGSTKVGGGTTSYAWFIWDKQDVTKQTQVKWINPGIDR